MDDGLESGSPPAVAPDPAPAVTTGSPPQRPTRSHEPLTRVRQVAMILVFDLGGPLLAYTLLRSAGLSTVPALIISGILPALGIPTPLSRDRAIGSGDQLQRRDEALTRLPLSNYLASVNGVVEDFVDVESTKRSAGTAFTARLEYLRRHSAPCRTILWKRRIKEMNRFRDDDDAMTVASCMGPESIGPCNSQRSEIDNSVRHSLRTLRRIEPWG